MLFISGNMSKILLTAFILICLIILTNIIGPIEGNTSIKGSKGGFSYMQKNQPAASSQPSQPFQSSAAPSRPLVQSQAPQPSLTQSRQQPPQPSLTQSRPQPPQPSVTQRSQSTIPCTQIIYQNSKTKKPYCMNTSTLTNSTKCMNSSSDNKCTSWDYDTLACPTGTYNSTLGKCVG